jgi:hypothetical protein
LNKLFIGLTLVALAFLTFIAGATITRFEIFPYGYLKDSFTAAEALFVQQSGAKNLWHVGAKPPTQEDLASPPVRDSEAGVGRYDPSRAFNGYTIYTPVRWQFPLRLIDMQGNSVHEWQMPLEQLTGKRDTGIDIEPPAKRLTVAYSRLLPNGALLAVISIAAYTPWGWGVVKLDKDSNLLWEYKKPAHHDLDVDTDGRIYALLHQVIRSPWPGLERIATPFLDDQIAVLGPDGKEQAVISVLEAIQNSDYKSLLMYANPDQGKGDLLHVNSITWLNAEAASLFPNAEAGNVLISIRQLDVLAVVDLETPTVKWALRGPWRLQHDPDVLADGRLLLFDNRGDIRNGGTSRILEFDPRSLEISWEYPGDQDEVLYTSIYGSQQRLENGNTLISESNNGRILEVTRSGDVVWEYGIPERKLDAKGNLVSTVIFAERFSRESLPFLQVP